MSDSDRKTRSAEWFGKPGKDGFHHRTGYVDNARKWDSALLPRAEGAAWGWRAARR